MPKLFVGRKKELQELNFLLNKKSASLVVIRGRRRIGKSQLAKEFGKTHRFFSFSGIAPAAESTQQTQSATTCLQRQCTSNCCQ